MNCDTDLNVKSTSLTRAMTQNLTKAMGRQSILVNRAKRKLVSDEERKLLTEHCASRWNVESQKNRASAGNIISRRCSEFAAGLGIHGLPISFCGSSRTCTNKVIHFVTSFRASEKVSSARPASVIE